MIVTFTGINLVLFVELAKGKIYVRQHKMGKMRKAACFYLIISLIMSLETNMPCSVRASLPSLSDSRPARRCGFAILRQ